MDITPDKKNIVDLVKSARNGRIVLPQFQRSFVWDYGDVQDLLVSILKGYFILPNLIPPASAGGGSGFPNPPATMKLWTTESRPMRSTTASTI